MTSDSPDRPARTEVVSELLLPYLRAWTDAARFGQPRFDDCATVGELCDFLADLVVKSHRR